MTKDDLIAIEQYRRFLRPDWRRWLPGDPERGLSPEQIKAQRHDFMLRDRAFETPLARRLRKEAEERAQVERERLEAEHRAEIEREVLAMKAELASLRVELVWAELRWKAECAERKRKADIAWERVMAAFMRGDFRQKANFNPDQPRDELGRWSDAGGAADGGGSGDNEGTENGDRSNAADEDAVPEPVQDRADRVLNRHIIENHVAKTDEELKARIRESQWRGLVARGGMDRNGSFDSIESARDFISQTIANNPADVARVAGGEEKTKFLAWRFGYQTGREAILDAPDAEVRMRPTYEVGVLIAHDPRADFGYRVVNAFPRNFNPRTGR
ncbi:MAG: RNase A-like domain-containing protein [Xanthobacteraceae bacterium]